MKRPVYIGVFLTPESRSKLLRTFPPQHQDIKADHVTLVFKPKDSDLAGFQIGQRVQFQVVGYAVDQKGQAVAVRLPPDVNRLSKNKNPHITISVSPGTKPVYSNVLLDQGEVSSVRPLTLEGVLDQFPRTVKLAKGVTAMEVSVNSQGIARDDEGNTWTVDTRRWPAGVYTGQKARQLAMSAPRGRSPQKQRLPEMSRQEHEDFRTLASKLIVALIANKATKHLKFVRDIQYKQSLTPKQKSYFDSLVRQNRRIIDRLPDKLYLSFDQGGKVYTHTSLERALSPIVDLGKPNWRDEVAIYPKGTMPKQADVTHRVATRYLQRQADLMPPLGYPGGQCHVVRRIVEEVKNPRLEQSLRDQVEEGRDLSNPAARNVYNPEKTKGAWKYNMVITPHAQYRMDLRGITEPELRRVLDGAFKDINAERSRGDDTRYRKLMSGRELEHYDPKLDIFIAFTARNDNAVIITTYRKKEKDPKRPTSCPIPKTSPRKS